MDTSVIADILRFVTLRAPQNIEYEKDIVKFIRDYRIQDSYLPVESQDVSQDDNKFINSATAQFIFNLVKDKLTGVGSNQDLLSRNQDIASAVKNQFVLNERTPVWIDDFVDVIRNHMVNFDKKLLREELDAIVRNNFPSCTGISDYVEKMPPSKVDEVPVETGPSQFCIDYDILFDQLYILYVCKRKYPINLEYVMDGLRALHIIRFLNLENDRLEQEQRWLGGCLLSLLALLRRSTLSARMSSATSSYGMEKGSTDENRTRCAEFKLTNHGHFPIPQVRLESKEDLANLFGATPSIHKMFSYLIGYYKPFNNIRPLGIGDLLIVRQFLKKYEAGEISHIENILKGESKDHSFRTLNRTEDTYTSEAEVTTENDKELQTTSRYELQNEVATTIQEDLSAQLSTSVSATYGVVSFSANAGVSYHNSKSESSRTASNFSKEIVDRAVSKIQKRVLEERTNKKISEIEEIDKHGFDNVKGNGNVTGIYRWLNKRYIAQVYNYGKRLMFEFVIPEPASFIKDVVERNKKKLSPPQDTGEPTKPIVDLGKITQTDIATYASMYNIDTSSLDPYPPSSTINTVAKNDKAVDSPTGDFSVDIPIGYMISSATAVGGSIGTKSSKMFLSIGGDEIEVKASDDTCFAAFDPTTFTMSPPEQKGKLSISVRCINVNYYSVTITGTLDVTPEAMGAWQNKAYGMIMDGYNKKLAEYKGQQSDYQTKLQEYNANQGLTAQGFNPAINEEIIKTELKKYCLSMITKQFASDKYQTNDINFSAMRSKGRGFDGDGKPIALTMDGFDTQGKPIQVPDGIPAIDIDEAHAKGTLIQFLEQAFEWPQITYLLYPYFWGQLSKWWFDAQEYFNEADPLYAKFLQAGSVRVLIAVHPAYETAVMHYLYTQEPWNGGEAPTLNDPMYIPIYEELHNQQDDLNGAMPYGDPWEVVIPTSLVYLQSSNELPTFENPADK